MQNDLRNTFCEISFLLHSIDQAVYQTMSTSHTEENDPFIKSQLASPNYFLGLMWCQFGHVTLEIWSQRTPQTLPCGLIIVERRSLRQTLTPKPSAATPHPCTLEMLKYAPSPRVVLTRLTFLRVETNFLGGGFEHQSRNLSPLTHKPY